jgi:hypothetical protein
MPEREISLHPCECKGCPNPNVQTARPFGEDGPWVCMHCKLQGEYRLLRALFGTDMNGEVVH